MCALGIRAGGRPYMGRQPDLELLWLALQGSRTITTSPPSLPPATIFPSGVIACAYNPMLGAVALLSWRYSAMSVTCPSSQTTGVRLDIPATRLPSSDTAKP